MDDYIREMWGGPGHFRFYLQPLMVILLGLRDGIADAKAGRRPYLFSLFTEHAPWSDKLRRLVRKLAFPLVLAFVMDFFFQLYIRGSWRPGATLIYALMFVATPYALTRALTNRIRRHGPRQGRQMRTSFSS